ncbi:hypothetical protein HHK36_008611 [Tetracentron sinense]|uniref:Uncharacterized protein n=1 Tax=Tetracentron sinense TaxID=13715 RepID=A0A834ZJT9_TETSI|nr:hypothetical protein HHK36_008611 [Tetracentron sinense]
MNTNTKETAAKTTLSLWVAKMDAFFDIPNPRIYRLLIISSTTTFFLGLAMIIEWLAHGRHHPGYGWMVYYAPAMMALPVLVSLSLFFAIFFCDKAQIQHLSKSLYLPKSKESQPPPPQQQQPQLETKELQLIEAKPLEDLQGPVQVQSIHSEKTGSTHESGCSPQLEEPRCEEGEGEVAVEPLPPHAHDSMVISQGGVTPAMVATEEDMEPVAMTTAPVHDSTGFSPHVCMMIPESENNKGKDPSLAHDSTESTTKETCLRSPVPVPGGRVGHILVCGGSELGTKEVCEGTPGESVRPSDDDGAEGTIWGVDGDVSTLTEVRSMSNVSMDNVGSSWIGNTWTRR